MRSVLLKNECFFPFFLIGLIITTYLNVGEIYIAFSGVAVIFYAIKEAKKSFCFKSLLNMKFFLKKISTCVDYNGNGFILLFLGYYFIITVFGFFLGSVTFKDLLEFILKYFFLPTVIYFLIPCKSSEKINLIKILKFLILICIIYGFIESIIKYNFIGDIISISSKDWMLEMNGSTNYQPSSFFLHYNYYGCVLVLGLVLIKYVPYENKIMNVIYWILLIEQILLCQSRINWIAAGFFLMMEFFRNGVTRKKLYIVLGLLVGVLMIFIIKPSIIISIWMLIYNRFSRLWIYGFLDGSLGQRLGTLLNWRYFFSDNPIGGVFGIGYNSVSTAYLPNYSYFNGYSTVDCQYTVFLVETGMIGILILFIGLFWILYKNRVVNSCEDIFSKINRSIIIIYLIEFITLDLVSNNILLSLLMMFFFLEKHRNE